MVDDLVRDVVEPEPRLQLDSEGGDIDHALGHLSGEGVQVHNVPFVVVWHLLTPPACQMNPQCTGKASQSKQRDHHTHPILDDWSGHKASQPVHSVVCVPANIV